MFVLMAKSTSLTGSSVKIGEFFLFFFFSFLIGWGIYCKVMLMRPLGYVFRCWVICIDPVGLNFCISFVYLIKRTCIR